MSAFHLQINDLKVLYALRKDEKLTAAKIAIKMLVEDEYIIDTVIMVRKWVVCLYNCICHEIKCNLTFVTPSK